MASPTDPFTFVPNFLSGTSKYSGIKFQVCERSVFGCSNLRPDWRIEGRFHNLLKGIIIHGLLSNYPDTKYKQ